MPYNQCDKDPVIKLNKYDEVKDKIEELNAIIVDEKLLDDYFDMLVESKNPFCPYLPYGNHYLRALYNRVYLPDEMSGSRKVKIENAISCETHRRRVASLF